MAQPERWYEWQLVFAGGHYYFKWKNWKFAEFSLNPGPSKEICVLQEIADANYPKEIFRNSIKESLWLKSNKSQLPSSTLDPRILQNKALHVLTKIFLFNSFFNTLTKYEGKLFRKNIEQEYTHTNFETFCSINHPVSSQPEEETKWISLEATFSSQRFTLKLFTLSKKTPKCTWKIIFQIKPILRQIGKPKMYKRPTRYS